MNLFESFVHNKEGYMYSRRLEFKTVRAVCEYVEGLLGVSERVSQNTLCVKYNVSPNTIRRHYEAVTKIVIQEGLI